MAKCLKCEKDYEAKKSTSKFCCTNCRIAWNRKNKGNAKKERESRLEELCETLISTLEEMNVPILNKFPSKAQKVRRVIMAEERVVTPQVPKTETSDIITAIGGDGIVPLMPQKSDFEDSLQYAAAKSDWRLKYSK